MPCETTPIAFVVWLPACIEGNETNDILVGSSIVKAVGSLREEARSGAPLAFGECPRLSMELLHRGAWP
jgi:hypothetical protein